MTVLVRDMEIVIQETDTQHQGRLSVESKVIRTSIEMVELVIAL